MSTFGGIELGKRALQTQQRSLDVTGHNIANANNEDYTRQRAIQSATDPYTVPSLVGGTAAGQVGTGVNIEQIERLRELFTDIRIRNENSALGEWSVKKENLKEIESIFNELGEGSLTSALNKFWESFDNLSSDGHDMNIRETLVQNAITLTTQINHIDKSLNKYREHLGTEIEANVGKINDLTRRIADLNGQIKAVESGMNKSANDLMDERDGLLDDLSKLADVQISFDDYNQAQISLNGINLVQGDSAKEIEIEMKTEYIPVDVDTDDDLTADTTENYEFQKYGFKVGNNDVEIKSGEIKGLMDVRDTIIDHKVNKLDKLSREIKNHVNYVHKSGYGLGDPTRSTGVDFFVFDPAGEFESQYLKVNPNIVDDLNLIAASSSADPADVENGDIAAAIFELKSDSTAIDGTTFENFWHTQAAQLGVEINRAERMESNQEILVDQLQEKRQEVSGVSLDEEMTEMIKYQHAYNAAAKVVSKMDSMLETLINGII